VALASTQQFAAGTVLLLAPGEKVSENDDGIR
jgi:hypothetical protein